jgi:hypothetical protein
MSASFHKFKLLLDENLSGRRSFATLNRIFDVKHIALDLRKGGLRDEHVYREAIKLHRLIITFNAKDFKPMAGKSQETGIICVSPNLPDEQIDAKLVALLIHSTPKALYGKFTALTGETLA